MPFSFSLPRRVLVLVVVAGACRSASTLPTCEQAIGEAVTYYEIPEPISDSEDFAAANRLIPFDARLTKDDAASLVKECQGWSQGYRQCIARARSRVDYVICNQRGETDDGAGFILLPHVKAWLTKLGELAAEISYAASRRGGQLAKDCAIRPLTKAGCLALLRDPQ